MVVLNDDIVDMLRVLGGFAQTAIYVAGIDVQGKLRAGSDITGIFGQIRPD